jgi:hypothetical protein
LAYSVLAFAQPPAERHWLDHYFEGPPWGPGPEKEDHGTVDLAESGDRILSPM